ncbi:MAG: universal stress protein [Planctomycetia bacterium]|nr:universal stress protein [Planctomycetia bacterium]
MSSMTVRIGYTRILVAVDFSPYAEAALKQAVWLAPQMGATITLAHALPHLLPPQKLNAPVPKMKMLTDLLNVSGEGARYEAFERETRQHADAKLRHLVDQYATNIDVQFKVLQGEPFVEIIHTVQQEGYDLVLAGTRGLAAWQQFFVGSTAKRLIRKCPSSVWIVKTEHGEPPKRVLAATDFSEVSRRAAREGLSIARQAGAEFHLLHVIDSMDMPEDAVAKMPQGSSLRREINEEAKERLDGFVESLHTEPSRIHRHLSWGTPWKDIGRLVQRLKIDLIAIGTVGRSGVKGLFLGNTAEKVLGTCDCSILTVKPADFVSPIEPSLRQSQPVRPAGP